MVCIQTAYRDEECALKTPHTIATVMSVPIGFPYMIESILHLLFKVNIVVDFAPSELLICAPMGLGNLRKRSEQVPCTAERAATALEILIAKKNKPAGVRPKQKSHP